MCVSVSVNEEELGLEYRMGREYKYDVEQPRCGSSSGFAWATANSWRERTARRSSLNRPVSAGWCTHARCTHAVPAEETYSYQT